MKCYNCIRISFLDKLYIQIIFLNKRKYEMDYGVLISLGSPIKVFFSMALSKIILSLSHN